MGQNHNVASSSEGGFQQANPSELLLTTPRRPANFDPNPSKGSSSYHPPEVGPSYRPPPPGGQSYRPPQTPPPPPPPSNVGHIPTFLPNTDYINMPSSVAGPRQGVRPGLVGVGAGALAAGAVIFGDDFMSGFDIPATLPDPTLAISIDPPF